MLMRTTILEMLTQVANLVLKAPLKELALSIVQEDKSLTTRLLNKNRFIFWETSNGIKYPYSRLPKAVLNMFNDDPMWVITYTPTKESMPVMYPAGEYSSKDEILDEPITEVRGWLVTKERIQRIPPTELFLKMSYKADKDELLMPSTFTYPE